MGFEPTRADRNGLASTAANRRRINIRLWLVIRRQLVKYSQCCFNVKRVTSIQFALSILFQRLSNVWVIISNVDSTLNKRCFARWDSFCYFVDAIRTHSRWAQSIAVYHNLNNSSPIRYNLI
jgi:hypothetical protein